jgi:hypothetical protein
MPRTCNGIVCIEYGKRFNQRNFTSMCTLAAQPVRAANSNRQKSASGKMNIYWSSPLMGEVNRRSSVEMVMGMLEPSIRNKYTWDGQYKCWENGINTFEAKHYANLENTVQTLHLLQKCQIRIEMIHTSTFLPAIIFGTKNLKGGALIISDQSIETNSDCCLNCSNSTSTLHTDAL